MNKYSQYVYTDNIKKAREEKKINAVKMAKLLGLNSKVSYYNIENGVTEPKITTMIQISKILGKSMKNFFNLKVQ